jgi:hypothetical protein
MPALMIFYNYIPAFKAIGTEILFNGNQNKNTFTSGPRGTLKCNTCLHFLQV